MCSGKATSNNKGVKGIGTVFIYSLLICVVSILRFTCMCRVCILCSLNSTNEMNRGRMLQKYSDEQKVFGQLVLEGYAKRCM